MTALSFNVCLLVGLLTMFAGAWSLFGFRPALLGLGCMIWISTMLAARLAVAMRSSGGGT